MGGCGGTEVGGCGGIEVGDLVLDSKFIPIFKFVVSFLSKIILCNF